MSTQITWNQPMRALLFGPIRLGTIGISHLHKNEPIRNQGGNFIKKRLRFVSAARTLAFLLRPRFSGWFASCSPDSRVSFLRTETGDTCGCQMGGRKLWLTSERMWKVLRTAPSEQQHSKTWPEETWHPNETGKKEMAGEVGENFEGTDVAEAEGGGVGARGMATAQALAQEQVRGHFVSLVTWSLRTLPSCQGRFPKGGGGEMWRLYRSSAARVMKPEEGKRVPFFPSPPSFLGGKARASSQSSGRRPWERGPDGRR